MIPLAELNKVTNTNDNNSSNNQQWRERRKDIAAKLLDGYSRRTECDNDVKSQPDENNDTALDEFPYRRRYLWTDAFALANYISLIDKDEKDLPQKSVSIQMGRALNLIEAVHETLGKHRLDHKDPQKAGTWLPNASEVHPTAGGLRIGKLQDERPLNVPFDASTEWDKDGQYFHYLTKWGTALDMMTRSSTNQQKFTIWAMELVEAAASKFVIHQYGRPQMYWKLAIDLSRPQVTSQGARDALEGYILASRLIATCDRCHIFSSLLPKMFHWQLVFHSMITISETDDPLELGGMLLDMCQLFLLEKQMGSDNHRKVLLDHLKKTVMAGLQSFVTSKESENSPDVRTPFRELGLSLGLRGMERLVLDHRDSMSSSSLALLAQLSAFEEILFFLPFAERIETFWLNTENHSSKSWIDHLDMNEIMLASSLNPSCWLQ